MPKKWDREKVIEELQALYKQGIDISLENIKKNYKGFYAAAIKRFGSWDELCKKAGIDYSILKKQKKEEKRKQKRQSLIEKIKEMYNQGLDIRECSIRKENPSIYKMAYYYFGNWSKLLSKAKINYEDLETRIKEQKKQDLLERIKKAYDNGVKLDRTSIIKDPTYKTLYWQAKLFYSGKTSWEDALTDAGVDYKQVVRQEKWTKEKVKKEIIKRKEEGKPLDFCALRKDYSGLYRAICRLFSSYSDALHYSGISTSKIQKLIKKSSYTIDEIIQNIIFYSIKNTNLKPKWILSKENKDKRLRALYYTAVRRFKSWGNALRTAGIAPDKYIKSIRKWSKEDVKREIHELYNKGIALNPGNIKKNFSALYKAGIRYFSSWEKTIEECGLEYKNIIKNGIKLTTEQIISEIKKLYKNCKKPCISFVTNNGDINIRRLYYQACKKFGSWDNALEAAGLNPSEIRLKRKKYTLDELIEKVMFLNENGNSLKIEDIKKDREHLNCYRAIVKRFGSWGEFLERLGIDSKKYTRRHYKDGNYVISLLKKLYPEGIVTGVRNKDDALYAAILKYFGGIENACESAGLVYSKSGKITKKLLNKNPHYLTIIYEHNKDFLNNIAKRVYYGAKKRGIRTLEIRDLEAEAFVIFCEKILEKPPKVNLRKFVYKTIYYSLIKLNKNNFKEIPLGDLIADDKDMSEEKYLDFLVNN